MKRWLPLDRPHRGAVCRRRSAREPPAAQFQIIEATIPDIQEALRRGELTSRGLVEMYPRASRSTSHC